MANAKKTFRLKRWILGGFLSVLMLLGVGVWYAYRAMQVFSMHNQVYQETKSPDGKYVATLAYSDGPTFGYFFVCLQSSVKWHHLEINDPIPKDEVTEVAAEGLDSVAWQGNHILIVKYVKSGNEAAEFDLRQKA